MYGSTQKRRTQNGEKAFTNSSTKASSCECNAAVKQIINRLRSPTSGSFSAYRTYNSVVETATAEERPHTSCRTTKIIKMLPSPDRLRPVPSRILLFKSVANSGSKKIACAQIQGVMHANRTNVMATVTTTEVVATLAKSTALVRASSGSGSQGTDWDPIPTQSVAFSNLTELLHIRTQKEGFLCSTRPRSLPVVVATCEDHSVVFTRGAKHGHCGLVGVTWPRDRGSLSSSS